jgi:hypothetical protein
MMPGPLLAAVLPLGRVRVVSPGLVVLARACPGRFHRFKSGPRLWLASFLVRITRTRAALALALSVSGR